MSQDNVQGSGRKNKAAEELCSSRATPAVPPVEVKEIDLTGVGENWQSVRRWSIIVASGRRERRRGGNRRGHG